MLLLLSSQGFKSFEPKFCIHKVDDSRGPSFGSGIRSARKHFAAEVSFANGVSAEFGFVLLQLCTSTSLLRRRRRVQIY